MNLIDRARHQARLDERCDDADQLAGIHGALSVCLKSVRDCRDRIADPQARRVAASIVMRLEDELDDAQKDVRGVLDEMGVR